MKSKYDASSIKTLDPIDHIRQRPGMYLPDVGLQGLHHLIEEIVDNAVDEHLAGYGNEIHVTIHDGVCDKVDIKDFGRGIPTGLNKDLGIDTLTAIFTKTMTGGKFDQDSYKTSAGLNGIGLKVVNAVSKDLEVITWRDNKAATQKFSRGHVLTPIQYQESTSTKHGTRISFIPDNQIFEVTRFDKESLSRRFHYLSSIIPGLKIEFKYHVGNGFYKTDQFIETEPLVSIQRLSVKEIFNSSAKLFEYQQNLRDNNFGISLTLEYYQNPKFFINSFVNTIHTYENGSHVDAVLDALVNSLRKLTGKSFSKNQILTGLGITLSVFYNEPVFRGQHKGKLADARIHQLIYNNIYSGLYSKLSVNKPFLNYLVELLTKQENITADLDIKKAVNNLKKSASENRLPAKLAVAYNATIDTRELFIVEGDSAAGSVKMARNPKFQEVLPIKGKIINAFRTQYTDLLKSKEVSDIFLAMGSMESSNTALRTKNVFILADPDPDAAHIVSLLLSLFSVVYPSFVKSNNLYVVIPPLFSLIYGDKRVYGHSMEDVKKKFNKQYPNKKFDAIYRNKGLGEMDPVELKEVIDPKTRKCIKITYGDHSRMELEKLMGVIGDIRKLIVDELEEEQHGEDLLLRN